MSRNIQSANRQSRRAGGRVSRTLQSGSEHEARFSARRQARAQLRTQELELELFDDYADIG